MQIKIVAEEDQEAIERVRQRAGDRSWADTVRRLVREADAKCGEESERRFADRSVPIVGPKAKKKGGSK